jgi:uncharacterized protein (TIGR03083 family)
MVDRAFNEQLADVWGDLVALGRTLSPADWERPTECPGWSVQDQLAHIVGTESLLLGRALADPGPAEAGPTGPHVHNPIGEVNEAWIAPRRLLSGSAVLAEFEEVTALRLAALAAMTDDQLLAVGPSPIGRVPYAEFMDVRVMDCWVHDQDMRQALGRPGGLEGPGATAAVDRLVSSFGYVVGKRVSPAEGTTVMLVLTGPQARTRAVRIEGGRGVEVPVPTDPTTTLTTDAAAFARLTAGRAGAEGLEAAGLVGVAGDRDLGRRVLNALNVMP